MGNRRDTNEDERIPVAPAPSPEPMPQMGGSYRREADGSLTPLEGPAVPAPQPEAQE